MSIRDIKSLMKIIDFKISLGLNLDSSICEDFENKTRHQYSNSECGMYCLYFIVKLLL